MIKKVLLSTIVMYGLCQVVVKTAERVDNATCKGWQCEELWCPSGYSIETPTGEYIKCENLKAYLERTGL